ncbi:GCN5-related N-acetyltransferase [Candidatus Koribacter versatilis Ellin345]|uniref:GCN5-related N-acetyltransferase n=1 Tax=Koribacter versatilis (strain Ellin345) TaxID=204669 RepID=Q1ISK1_KORVE|nr:GNAT family N-acetyltransferase [Candidatus Koribacter versatilis]ABF40149.1 GCN5-related N-acetyltransferase [Candidatus Koribacter versatilis Ellin345]
MPRVVFFTRRASTSDAEALSEFARAVFPLGGRPGAAQADLDAYFEEKLTPDRFREAIADTNVVLFIAEFEQKIAGYGELWHDSPHPQLTEPHPSEVRKLYVGPNFHGSGVAHALMLEMLAYAAHPVWLGVFSENPRAIRFYERFGFKIIGTQQFLVGNDPQEDFLMRRDEQKGTA